MGGDLAHRSVFLRDAMRCTINCPSYVPDIPVLITYASNCSDVSLEQLRLRRACAIVHYRQSLSCLRIHRVGTYMKAQAML